MGYTAGVDRATSYKVTAANWNEQLGATGSLVTVHDALYTCTQTDVAASRAVNGTIYQNTTGKVVIAMITINYANTSAVATFICDSNASPTTQIGLVNIVADNVLNTKIATTFIVPPSFYYKVAPTGSINIVNWFEWTLG